MCESNNLVKENDKLDLDNRLLDLINLTNSIVEINKDLCFTHSDLLTIIKYNPQVVFDKVNDIWCEVLFARIKLDKVKGGE